MHARSPTRAWTIPETLSRLCPTIPRQFTLATVEELGSRGESVGQQNDFGLQVHTDGQWSRGLNSDLLIHMHVEGDQSGGGYDVASGLVTFVGLYEGLVPVLGRLLFGADQRFAPALWLPPPWWWIACVAVVLVTLVVLALLHDAKQRRFPHEREGALPSSAERDSTDGESGTGVFDAISAVVFLVGIYNGVAPFIARLVFDGNLLLALPLRLRAPWWWITSLAVIVATIVILAVIDEAKQRQQE
jgi:hypothetical protein